MFQRYQEVAIGLDYILITNQRTFSNIKSRYPHYNRDHYMFLGCLRSRPLQENKIYLGSQ